MTSTSPAGLNEFWDQARQGMETTKKLFRLFRRVSSLRLVVVAAALVMAFVALEAELFSLWWILLPAFVFAGLALGHQELWRRVQRTHRVAEMHYRAALRVDRDTKGEEDRPRTPAAAISRGGAPASRPTLEQERRIARRLHRIRRLGDEQLGEHLDLFRSEQLFERLADWRTDAGGETLATWMLRPAPPAEVKERQAAISELRSRPGIREALAATGCLEEWPNTPDSLVLEWLGAEPPARPGEETAGGAEETAPEAPDAPGEGGSGKDAGGGAADTAGTEADPSAPWPAPPSPRLEAVIGCLALFLSAGLIAQLIFTVPNGTAIPVFITSLAAAVLLGLWQRSRVQSHERVAKLIEPEIRGLQQIAASLSNEGFTAPRLIELNREFADARRALAGLHRLHTRLFLRRNLLFAPLAALVFWSTHHVRALNRWRRRHREALRRWIRAGGEYDALVALAQYAAERPGHVFAEFDDRPRLEAVNLGHPLIPEMRLQRNTVRLGQDEPEVLIVTGSNMSGKSTLLRSIGANFVLARMGAPTTATTFRLGPLSLGVSIAVHDSLKDGVSRFLAELLALRTVLDTGSPEEPLLFLLDEVLQGTNSNDRRAATSALLTELGRRNALGVMTTHDLSLTELTHELPGRARNMHFTERVVDGTMDFDYQLREGVLPHGNALDLMRILKLPAPEAEGSEFTTLPSRGVEREH